MKWRKQVFKIYQILFVMDRVHWRLKKFLTLKRWGYRKQNNSSILASDSENTSYVRILKKLNNDKKRVRNFRKEIDYKYILEHVDAFQGKKYLDICLELENKNEISFIKNLLQMNDSFGSPRRVYYEPIGLVSPTSLRYLKVALEISKMFDIKPRSIISELGIGYGGQASILSKILDIKEYHAYDIPEACKLTLTFLEATNKKVPLIFKDIDSNNFEKPDLFISNYAFSELPKELQKEYLEKVICFIPNGYMTMNSGKENQTKRSFGKLRTEEILEFLPNPEIIEERPNTGVDNYLIVWRR